MQVSVKNNDILASLLTDPSAITISFCKNEESNRGRGFWKFNNSLVENKEHVYQTKKFISATVNEFFNENILDDQIEYKYSKYNIRNYTINFSKNLTKLKHFEKKNKNRLYKVFKQQLDAIYEKATKGIKIRSKCNWYELGKKSTKFFLKFEKDRAIQSQIHSLIINQDEITDQDEINKQIFSFYQYLFSRKVQNQTDKTENSYLYLNLPMNKY